MSAFAALQGRERLRWCQRCPFTLHSRQAARRHSWGSTDACLFRVDCDRKCIGWFWKEYWLHKRECESNKQKRSTLLALWENSIAGLCSNSMPILNQTIPKQTIVGFPLRRHAFVGFSVINQSALLKDGPNDKRAPPGNRTRFIQAIFTL